MEMSDFSIFGREIQKLLLESFKILSDFLEEDAMESLEMKKGILNVPSRCIFQVILMLTLSLSLVTLDPS